MITTLRDVRIAGLAAAVPRDRVANADSPLLAPEERQKVIKTTGIEHRRVSRADQCASDLCFAAADQLLTRLGWNRAELGVLVLVTQTGDAPLPPTSYLLAHRLGLGRGAVVFDVNLGCSGFTHGLSIVGSLLNASGLGRGLLLCGDTLSKLVSAEDRSTSLLFGDAGTATALEAAPGQRMVFDFGSDGAGAPSIQVPDGGARHPFSARSLVPEVVAEGVSRNRAQLALDGVEVFNFSLREVPKTVQAVMDSLSLTPDQVDAFVFHQANLMMNELIRKKLKLAPDRVPYSLREFGNTSSASIPMTLVTQLGARLREGPMKLVACGFGVGLSWSTAYLETDRVECLPLIEL